jgi:hypothetical protein
MVVYMSDFDITKVKKLTREDMDNKTYPKVTLEGLKRMCNFLDENNPATYEIFLMYRPDLAENEVRYYQDIIATLKENIKLRQQIINENLRTFDECFKVDPPSVILQPIDK